MSSANKINLRMQKKKP